MTPEAQQIAIAEWRGWKFDPLPPPLGERELLLFEVTSPDGERFGARDQIAISEMLPDYVNSLDAIHGVVKFQGRTRGEARGLDFIFWLNTAYTRRYDQDPDPCLPRNIVWAEASDWAEALLRTLGKWKDEP